MRPNRTLTLSWRIGVPNYESDAAFQSLRDLLVAHRDIVDEVALFETWTHHLYLPLEELSQRARLMGHRLRALKEAGIPSVGFNILTTIGHTNEAWSYLPPLPFQPMVGHDGTESRGCACPNTPELRQYVWEKYRLMAAERPDFIWVDDDIRMHNHGVSWACFCPTCLQILSANTGQVWSREALVEALESPQGTEVRAAWVAQNVRTLESLLEHVAAAIHSVDPTIRTGLMTAGPGWTTYSGFALERWFTALRATKARPGGGFYADDPRSLVLVKAFEVGRQVAPLPPPVTDRQYELENFPYQVLKKSPASVTNECALALMMGLNGVAVNALGNWGGAFDDYFPLLARLREVRPVWEQLVGWVEGLPAAGLWPAWSAHLAARRRVLPGESWLWPGRWYDINLPNVLAEIGLPLCMSQPGCGTILAGRVAEVFSDAQLREMLSGGVLMDGTALTVLQDRGLEHLTGVRVARRLDNGTMERLTGDPLNGPHAGELRDARIEFWGDASGMADVLEPTAAGVRVLTMAEDYYQRPLGPAMTAFENDLGGRVVVMGYAPWTFIHSGPKRTQLLRAADWLSRETLPAWVEETLPITPLVRISQDRSRGAVVLLNHGLETIPRATLRVRAQGVPVQLIFPGGTRQLPQTPDQGSWSVTLSRMEPWSVTCLVFGR